MYTGTQDDTDNDFPKRGSSLNADIVVEIIDEMQHIDETHGWEACQVEILLLAVAS